MSGPQYGSERQRTLEMRLRQILKLPLRQQATCVLLAAELSLPLWKSFEKQNGADGAAERFVDCFQRWLIDEATEDELETSSKPLAVALPDNLMKLEEPSAGMAGYSLHDVKLIALGQCEDVHDDILFDAICWSSAAACGGQVSPTSTGWDNLTEPQLDLLDGWWAKCSEIIPQLR